MDIDFDPAKEAINLAKHGMSLSLAQDFEWSSAIVVEDTRRDYGEQRFTAFGLIGDRLFVVVFTMRGLTMRVIGLRKANRREVKYYERA